MNRIGTTSHSTGWCSYHHSPVYDTMRRFCEYVYDHRPEIGGTAYPSDCDIHIYEFPWAESRRRWYETKDGVDTRKFWWAFKYLWAFLFGVGLGWIVKVLGGWLL